MVALIALVLFAGIVVACVGGLVWLVRHYGRLQRDAWQNAATHLGLNYDGRQIVGTRHGQRVRVCTVTRGSGDSRTTYTVVSSQLPMALDLGFKLRKHGFLNNMFHASEDHVVGDPRFDDAFIVSADERHRVRSLLGPKLRRLLVQQLGTSSSFDVSDHGATIETTGVSSSIPWLTWAVESATRICSGLELARHSVPVATPLAPHRHAWRNFAIANHMKGMDTPLCMWGPLEGVNVKAHAVRTGRGTYEMEVDVAFSTPLGIGLRLQPIGMMDKIAIFFGSQDHKFGDDIFDDTFRVKVSYPEGANAMLDETVRRDLLMLQHDLGPVSLTDHAVSVRLKHVPLHSPMLVPMTVRRMLGVVDELGSRAGAATVGPYR